MASGERTPAERRLEGLVLRDSTGALYEVPRVVIERYRLAAEYESAPDYDARDTPTWSVHAAVYAPEPPSNTPKSG